MSQAEELRRLSGLLESFLEEALKLKGDRLRVLQTINRLDDIARKYVDGATPNDEFGGWLAQHHDWLGAEDLRETDRNRIVGILGRIRRQIEHEKVSTPESRKLASEISRWTGPDTMQEDDRPVPRKIVLKRPPEEASSDLVDHTIPEFAALLAVLPEKLTAFSQGRQHLLSALDLALNDAEGTKSKEALLLSALAIYYLRLNGYLVDPFVKRLKAVERHLKKDATHA